MIEHLGSPLPETSASDDAGAVNKVYVFTDLVGSLDLKQRWGDTYGRKIQLQHDAAFRECLEQFGGEENKETGDGFHAVFPDAPSAVGFAVAFHRRLDAIGSPEPLRCRIGIHAGPSFAVLGSPPVPGNVKYVGAAVDLAYKIMRAAEGRQTLVTRQVFDPARESESSPGAESDRVWLAHGAYRFKGLADPVELFEVGARGFAPLSVPPGDDTIRRIAPHDEETLGWRPGVGALLPSRPEIRLEKKIGEGGFGEVWLGRDIHTSARTVFKFCFEVAKLRALRREQTILRLIREALGDRSDIARLLKIELTTAPYYLESEYAEGGDLVHWAAGAGGLGAVPLATRLEIAAQTADAVAAGHSVGVIHKDIKPTNILVRSGDPTRIEVLLSDFGIAALEDTEALDRLGVTAAGFTLPASERALRGSSESGTRLFMAPELLAGRRATIQSDIYALGVLLFQLVVGDFRRPIGMGWEKSIEDELLRADIAECIAGDPLERLSDARILAQRLRTLDRRRADLESKHKQQRRLEIMQKRRKATLAVASIAALVALLATVVAVIEYRLRSELEYENYISNIRNVWTSQALSNAEKESDLEKIPERLRSWDWGYNLYRISPEPVRLIGHTAPLRWAAFSNCEKYIVTASEDKTARIWDRSSGIELAVLRGHEEWVLFGSFDPKSERVITASDDHTARVWDLKGNPIFVLQGHEKSVAKARFSPDNRWILTTSDDKTAKLWDANTGELRFTLRSHEKWIFDGNFSPDSKRIVTASDDHTAKVWDVETGSLVFTLLGHEGEVNSVEYHRDGHLILTGSSDGTARLWNADTGAELKRSTKEPEHIRRAAFTPEGDRFLALYRNYARVYETESFEILCQANADRGGDVHDAAFSIRNPGLLVTDDRDSASVYSIIDGERAFRIFHGSLVTVCAATANGYFLTASKDGVVKVFSSQIGNAFLEDIDLISCFAQTTDGAHLVTGDFAGHIDVHELDSGEHRTWRITQEDVRDIDVSPDNRTIVSADSNGVVALWDLTNGEEIRRLAGHPLCVRRIHFNKDGSEILSASEDGTAKVWQTATGNELFSLPHGDWVMDARFAPDGKSILTISKDGKARLWSRATGKEIWVLDFLQEEFPTALDYSHRGDRAAIGTNRGRILLYHAKTLKELASVQSEVREIFDLAFSPDGRRLVSTTEERAKLWDVDPLRFINDIRNDSERAGFLHRPADTLAITGEYYLMFFRSYPWRELESLGDASDSVQDRLLKWKQLHHRDSLNFLYVKRESATPFKQ